MEEANKIVCFKEYIQQAQTINKSGTDVSSRKKIHRRLFYTIHPSAVITKVVKSIRFALI